MTKVPQGELGEGRLGSAHQSWRNVSKGCFVCCGVLFVFTFNMASKTLDLSRDGRNLRIRIAASDLTVSRVSRAFQASKFVH